MELDAVEAACGVRPPVHGLAAEAAQTPAPASPVASHRKPIAVR
jgi:hypothetical protein